MFCKLPDQDKEEMERTLRRQCTNPLPSEPNIFGYEPLL